MESDIGGPGAWPPVTQRDFSPRESTAVGLLIARRFLLDARLNDEDQGLVFAGLELAWRWVEGREVSPIHLCEYIDGEINLPFRSTLYAEGSVASHAMAAVFLSMGLAALYACKEAGVSPSESVENFGSNELDVLNGLSSLLGSEDQERISRVRHILAVGAGDKHGAFGGPIRQADVDDTR
ncbi:hypothetical protein [Variovorax sp. E3]|uniref:hypothetical protein n=1 Tax=Variovorax sp. E3 TaxID=1914993 RepID=UPI0018DBB8FA|nr:hypothetical protein [Variovorax sp. E3]